MKQTKMIMGMPVTIDLVDPSAQKTDLEIVFNYFKSIDQKFSTFKKNSEVQALNESRIKEKDLSPDLKLILELAEQTKKETDGYFDIKQNGKIDPSGIVKGWAIWEAAKILRQRGYKNFYLDVGSDIQVSGYNKDGKKWQIGIRNPFNVEEIVKVLEVKDEGVATSGTYERGNHIYNPKSNKNNDEIVSLTVIGPNIYQADRFATAAFAMGKNGINFIEKLPGFEGYLIDKNGMATMTGGFKKYELH